MEGESGLGKTLFAQRLCKNSTSLTVYIPAIKCLKSKNIIDVVLEYIHESEPEADSNFLKKIIELGTLDICIDGLNEVDLETCSRIMKFSEQFKGNILLLTQTISLKFPLYFKTYILQPLQSGQDSSFFQKICSTEDNYNRCKEFISKLNYLGKLDNLVSHIITNPMSLTLIADILAIQKEEHPNIFRLIDQWYNIKTINSSNDVKKAIADFCDEVYYQWNSNKMIFQGKSFNILSEFLKKNDPMHISQYFIRHERFLGYFIARSFLYNYHKNIEKNLQNNYPYRKEIYVYLALLLPLEEAKKLQERLIDSAFETRDFIIANISILFIKLVQSRELLPSPNMQQVKNFFTKANIEFSFCKTNDNLLEITNVPLKKIQKFVPFPVLVYTERSMENDISVLLDYLKEVSRKEEVKERRDNLPIAIIFYQETIGCKTSGILLGEAYKLRVKKECNLIHIPLKEIESCSKKPIDVFSEHFNFILSNQDPFDEREPLSQVSTFYGNQKLLMTLEEKAFQYKKIGLIGLWKSGKTSVFQNIKSFIWEKHPIILINFQEYSHNSYYGITIFNKIIEDIKYLLVNVIDVSDIVQIDDKNSINDEIAVTFIERVDELNDRLRSKQNTKYEFPVICLLDEIEGILNSNEISIILETFKKLCDKSLMIIVISDTNPNRKVLEKYLDDKVYLPRFSREDTKGMIQGLASLIQIKFADDVLVAIYEKSGGYPYIARQIASLLYAKLIKNTYNDSISLQESQRFLDKCHGSSDSIQRYFEELWNKLPEIDQDILKDIVNTGGCLSKRQEYSDILSKLKNLGLIVSNDSGNLEIQPSIFNSWIKDTQKNVMLLQVNHLSTHGGIYDTTI